MQIKLDFNVNGSTARLDYLNNYLKGVDQSRLSQDNIEMMSNYILWGLESEDPNLDFEIESKNSPWSKGNKTTSLEALMEQEQETGKSVEAQLSDVALCGTRKKLDRAEVVRKLAKGKRDVIGAIAEEMVKETTKDCFAILGTLEELRQEGFTQSAAEAESEKGGKEEVVVTYSKEWANGKTFSLTRLTCNQSAAAANYIKDWHPLTSVWFDLWGQIDVTEFMVQNWELAHGKRRANLPIRPELHYRLARWLVWQGSKKSLAEFEEELIRALDKWEGYHYLKKKRSLVSLRTQQYVYLDAIQGDTLYRKANPATYWREEDKGLSTFYPFADPAFLLNGVTKENFTPEFQLKCVKALQVVDAIEEGAASREYGSIDLRDPNTVRNLILLIGDLEESMLRMSETEGQVLRNLLLYLKYYIDLCDFNPEVKAVLQLKMQKRSNKEIVEYLEKNFNLSYKENYISTIFTKRIVDSIIEQVNLHYRLLEFITIGPAVFKQCSKCHRLLPRNANYFNRRTSTSDGFFSSCKQCKTRRS